MLAQLTFTQQPLPRHQLSPPLVSSLCYGSLMTTTPTGIIWHQGLDPVNERFPAWRAEQVEADGTPTIAEIRVGKERFDEPGFTWEVHHNVFGWSGWAPTLEATIDTATAMLTSAFYQLMTEGY